MQVIFVTGHGREGTMYWGEAFDKACAKYTNGEAVTAAPGGILWKKAPCSCPAVLGRGGMGKTKEGDDKTPLGSYAVRDAYGILSDPGCHITYTRVTPELYWCGDSSSMYYNRPVYCSDTMPSAFGEHMMDYVPEYHYLLDIGYNEACEAGKGSGIFLHCRGKKDYTHGCIAVEEQYMISILRWLRPGAYIVIRRNHNA